MLRLLNNYKNSPIYIGLFLFILTLASYIIIYCMNAFIAQHLSSALYDDFSIALSTLLFLAIIIMFGSDLASKRFLPEYIKNRDKRNVIGYFAWNFKLILLTSATIIITFAIGLLTFHILNKLYLINFNRYHVLVYVVFIVPIFAFSELLANFLISNNNVILGTFIINIATYLFIFILFSVSIYSFDIVYTQKKLGVLLLFSSLITALISSLITNLEFKTLYISGLKKIFSKPSSKASQWSKLSGTLLINNILFVMLSTIDLYIVEIFGHNESSVGHYAAILTIATIITLVPGNIVQWLKPQIILQIKKPKYVLQKTITRLSLVITIIVASAFTIIICFSDFFIHKFGAGYNSIKQPLMFVAVGFLFTALSVVSSTVLMYANYEKLVAIIDFITLIVFMVLAIYLTTLYGIIGTAIANCLVLSFRGIFFILTLKLRLGFNSLFII